MSFFVGGAVLATTAVNAYSADKASKDQAKGVQKGIDASAALAKQARDDVNRLFQQGAAQGRAGLTGAFNFYKQAAPQRMAPVTQGFQQGINVLGQGAQQANNAILGLPVDMSFTNQQVQQAPTGYLDSAALPQAPMLGAADAAAQQPTVAQQDARSGGGIMPLAGALAGGGLAKKVASSSPAKKLIKKLF